MLEVQGLQQAEFTNNYFLLTQIFIYSSAFPEQQDIF